MHMTFTCLANVVWPSLYVAHYYYASWAIVFGFAIEWIAFRFWLHFSWKKAFLASLVVNALSASLGLILMPLSGLAWELTGGRVLWHMGGIGTFNPVSWTVSWILAVLLNAVIEFWPLVWPFHVKRSWRLFGIVFLVNMASVAFAFVASLFMVEPRM